MVIFKSVSWIWILCRRLWGRVIRNRIPHWSTTTNPIKRHTIHKSSWALQTNKFKIHRTKRMHKKPGKIISIPVEQIDWKHWKKETGHYSKERFCDHFDVSLLPSITNRFEFVNACPHCSSSSISIILLDDCQSIKCTKEFMTATS